MVSVWRLVRNDGRPVNRGELVTDFRGEVWFVAGWAPPRHSGSTGRVYCSAVAGSDEEAVTLEHEWFPSVVNLHWELVDYD